MNRLLLKEPYSNNNVCNKELMRGGGESVIMNLFYFFYYAYSPFSLLIFFYLWEKSFTKAKNHQFQTHMFIQKSHDQHRYIWNNVFHMETQREKTTKFIVCLSCN